MSAQNRGIARARHSARELLVKALYQWQLADSTESELLEQFREAPQFARADQAYFRELLHTVLADAAVLDVQLAAQATRDSAQQDAVGRAILFLALTELKTRPDVPTKVVINEAVELAKRYGPAQSFRFVNAVLDKVAVTMPARESA
jgi:N utilization substance protein B